MSLEFNLNKGDTSDGIGLFLPVKIIEEKLLSPTSEAYYCFTGQAFSANLQAYLINYVISTSNLYSVYA